MNAPVTTASRHVPSVALVHRSKELSGVLDHKVYVRGIGTVTEKTIKGGNERLVLESVRRLEHPEAPRGEG